MRIVFVGAVEFSRHCLEEILGHGGNVVAVFTLGPEDGGRHSDYADLAPVATRHGVPVYQVRDLNEPDSVGTIRSLHPDVLFAFGWSRLIAKPVRDVPPLGCVGTHPALLPRHRGRHPIVWALVEGLEESGLTFFYLDEEADSGDILWQQRFPITLEDDARSVYEKVKRLASDAIPELLPQIAAGTAPRVPQDHRQATYWRKRTEADGEIHWAAPTLTTYNLVRALTRPYVGAHTHWGDRKVIIWRTRLPQTRLGQPAAGLAHGTVIPCDDGAFGVRTGDGYLTIVEHDLLGGGRRAIPLGSQLGRLGEGTGRLRAS